MKTLLSKRNLVKSPSPQPSPVAKERKLPRRGDGFSSNHVMVNDLRKEHHVPPLVRSRELDDFARSHAETMAKNLSLTHSVEETESLQQILGSEFVGENIQRGDSIKGMHSTTVSRRSAQFWNLVSGDFTQFGMATARGADGKLYMCQVFRRKD